MPGIFNCFKYHEIWFPGQIECADHEFEIQIWQLIALSKLGVPQTMPGIFYCLKYHEIWFPGYIKGANHELEIRIRGQLPFLN
jgi:hypothetical protein